MKRSLAGCHSHMFILFGIATSSILFSFQRFPVLFLLFPAEYLHSLCLSSFPSQPSRSPSLDSKNIGGAKPLGVAGGLVVGLQGVLHLSPISEEDCTSNKPTRRPENRLECCAVLSFSLREILLQFHGAAGEGHM